MLQGVLLFLLYINDLPLSTDIDIFMFADDSTAVAQASNSTELEIICNLQLKKIQKWFTANRLALNLNKSTFMVFTSDSKPSPRLDIFFEGVNDISITQVPNNSASSVRLLGFWIDEKLTLRDHFSKITNKISKSLFFISRVKRIINIEARKLLYYAHIH